MAYNDHSTWLSRPILSSITLLSIILLLTRLPRMYMHYRSWLSMGPGGMPYNAFGWFAQSLLALLHTSADMFGVSIYESPSAIASHDHHALRSHLPETFDLPIKSHRPDVPRFFAPQRQTSMMIASSLRTAQSTSINNLAAMNSATVHIAPSRTEGGRCGAIFLNDVSKVPKGTERLRGEVGHAHTHTDGSLHVTLSLVDAKQVVEKGWGQRHLTSGRLLPLGYTMVYAPRSEEEIEVITEILKAAVRYQSCGANVR